MLEHYLTYLLLLFASAALSLGLAVHVWRRRDEAGARPFVVLMLAAAVWAVFEALQLAAQNLAGSMLFTRLEYLGILVLPAAWVALSLHFAGLGHLFTRRLLAALVVIPAVTLVALWTNDLHGLYYSSAWMSDSGPFPLLRVAHGPLFWLYTAYAYALLLVGAGLLVRTFLRAGGLRRKQAGVVVLGAACPWLANIVYVSGISPMPGVDMTPALFSVAGLAFIWGMFGFGLFNLTPIARETVIEQMRDGVIVLDGRNRVVDLNPAAEGALGCRASAAVGRPVAVACERWPTLADRLRETVETHEDVALGEGEATRFYELRVSPLRDRRGAHRGWLVVLRDVTEHRRAQEAIRRSEARYRALFERSPIGVFHYDVNLRMTDCNDRLAAILMSDRERLIGMDLTQLRDDRVLPAMRAALEGRDGVFEGLYRTTTSDAEIWATMRTAPMFDAAGNVIGGMGIVEDTTERRQAEEAQRLAAVGQLAAGVAHEFNNLLAAMMMAAELALNRGVTGEHRALAELVIRSARRGRDISRNLIAFARPREPLFRPLCIADPIEAALALAGRHLEGARVTVRAPHDPSSPCLQGDPAQLEQVFLNLIINACQAMPAGGELRLTTRLEERPDAGGEIVVTVADTGTGIAPEHLPRIFEPFFTTRHGTGDGDTPGSGLGLSVSHGIVTAHGGTIGVRSVPGAGTTFELRLPACEAPAEGSRPGKGVSTRAPEAGAGAPRILLVEDEEDLREVIVPFLEALGYEVASARDTDEALLTLRTRAFDVVVTDLTMPGEGGARVVAAAGELAPSPAVIVMTGKVQQRDIDEVTALGARTYLEKPFGMRALVKAITDALEVRHQP